VTLARRILPVVAATAAWLCIAVAGEEAPADPSNPPPADAQAPLSLGPKAKAAAPGSIAIGNQVEVGPNDTGGIAIGIKSYARSEKPGGGNIAIGEKARAEGPRAISIGTWSKAAEGAIAFGYGAWAPFENSIAIGRGAFTSAPHQTSIGPTGNDHIFFGNGHAHRFPDFLDIPEDQKHWQNQQPAKKPIWLHGRDAKDLADGTDVNIAGGALNLCGGCGTGTGQAGPVNFMVAPPRQAADPKSANEKNALQPALQVDANQAPGETRLLLYDPDAGTLRRVKVFTIKIKGKDIRVLGF